MKKLLRNSDGFSPAVIVLIVVVIGLLGFAGYRVYSSNHNKSDNSTSAQQPAASAGLSSTAQPAADNTYVSIKEWDVRMKRDPYFSSVSYAIGKEDIGVPAYITFKTNLDDTNPGCIQASNWGIYQYSPEDDSPEAEDKPTKIKDSELVKESVKLGAYKIINGMYYFLHYPQESTCGDSSKAAQYDKVGVKIDDVFHNMFDSLEATAQN